MPENSVRVNATGGPTAEAGPTAGLDRAVLVYATFPAPEAALEIGGELVEAGLAACVNVLAGMTAIYRWQGRINSDTEAVAVIKTRAALAERVVGYVRVRHSYANPALLVLPVTGGSAEFLAWIVAETRWAEPQ